MSTIPGPRSRARISTPFVGPSSRGRSDRKPSRACLTRLVASSVATRATLPPSASANPRLVAIAAALRRASPTWLASVMDRATESGTPYLLPLDDHHASTFADARDDVELV